MIGRDLHEGKDEGDTMIGTGKAMFPPAGKEVEAVRHTLEEHRIEMLSWKDFHWI